MPELPEVEITKRGLLEIIGDQRKVKKMKVFNESLRWPIPKEIPDLIKGQEIQSIERRAKYLLWKFPKFTMVVHLGMTGTWRLLTTERREKHDHVVITMSDGQELVYNDPRRFGSIEYFMDGEEYPRFGQIGVEPLSDDFNFDYLWTKSRKKEVPIKTFIMDQKNVVGVGNIYAVESLFLSGIRPTRKTKNITKKEAELLIENIKKVLDQAIEAGGSSISDFKNTDGNSGYFQHQFKVYGKAGEECPVCKTKLKNTTLSGRQSVWCPSCQK